mgnify:CR=1 FL=1
MAKELEKVDTKKVTIKIKGKERELKFGFKAWAILEREYGGIKNITKLQKAVEERPFETLPHLIYIGLVDKEGIEEESVLDDFVFQFLVAFSGFLFNFIHPLFYFANAHSDFANLFAD